MKREINRLKVVLAEKKRTNRWLAAQLGKNEATTNKSQPSLDDLVAIARCLEVDTKDLLHSITE
jgi:putative transcriptional regulator